MWLSKSPDANWQGPVASVALIVVLYAVQTLILRRTRNERHARNLYAVIMLITVPVCWGISPNWHSPICYPIATFVGWPVTVHAVPIWSFHRGLVLRRTEQLSRWRMTVLLFVALPVWNFVWGISELLLGWAWI